MKIKFKLDHVDGATHPSGHRGAGALRSTVWRITSIAKPETPKPAIDKTTNMVWIKTANKQLTLYDQANPNRRGTTDGAVAFGAVALSCMRQGS